MSSSSMKVQPIAHDVRSSCLGTEKRPADPPNMKRQTDEPSFQFFDRSPHQSTQVGTARAPEWRKAFPSLITWHRGCRGRIPAFDLDISVIASMVDGCTRYNLSL
jgi:hypothetical protein